MNSRGGPAGPSLASAHFSGKHGDMFRLDPRLEQDTVPLAKLSLAHVLLMCDARYPWLILVPEKPDLRELHDLGSADRTQLIEEITQVSRVLEQLFKPDKINVGALGNIVRQLHIHVIARRIDDSAWPGPAWGQGAAVPYSAEALVATQERLITALNCGITGFVPSDD
jgi:diadenosine tetraphosphate (Ap4A) HIT family hydrolase